MKRDEGPRALRWLVVILLVAFGLRLVNLGGRALWYDEAFSVLFAEKGLAAMQAGTLASDSSGAAEEHPLLYYGTLDGWMRVFGPAPAMVRLYSVFAGLLSVAVIYRLAADCFDRRVGLAAALIMALAPFQIQYAQETRMYALLLLLLLLVTWAYRRAWHSGRAGWWAAFGVLAALAMYTQQLAAFYLAALGLTPVMARQWRKLLPTAAAAGLALVLYLPWLLHLPGQLSKLQTAYWIQRPSILRPLLTLRTFATVGLDYPAPWSMAGFVVGLVLVVFLGLQVALRWRRLRRAERGALGWLLWLAFGSLGLLWIASQVMAPVYLDRALLAQAAVLYVALAWLFVRGGLPRPIVGVIAAGWLIVAGAAYDFHMTWDTFPNPPFSDAVVYLRAQAAPENVILHSNKLTALPMVYYDRTLPQSYMADRPGAGEDTLALPTQEMLGLVGADCLPAALGGARRVWFVIFAQEEAQYLSLPGVEAHPHLAWLRAHYQEEEATAFQDLRVIPFSDPDDYVPVCPEDGA
ncbi:MAG: glycosyltransferase family 39 protein [Anaerolineae bacterium]|nr:glycosyltransferase family 39 protein [Anaerolineae bacterium]